jgi:hypothetical protein
MLVNAGKRRVKQDIALSNTMTKEKHERWH